MDKRLAEMIERLTPPGLPIGTVTPAIQEDFVTRTLTKAVQSSNIVPTLVVILSSILEHHLFNRWCHTTAEQRDAGLPEEVENGFKQLEQHFAMAKLIIRVCAKNLNADIVRAIISSVQAKGIELRDEASENLLVVSQYYIGLRGTWGFLPLYKGDGIKIFDIFKSKVDVIEALLRQGADIPDYVKVKCARRLRNCTHFLEHQTAEGIEKGMARDNANFFIDGMDRIIEELEAYIAGGDQLMAFLELQAKREERAREIDAEIDRMAENGRDEADRDSD